MATNMPINQIVDVKITRNNAVPISPDFNNTLLIGYEERTPGVEYIPTIPQEDRIRIYTDIMQVQAEFSVDSQIYKQAAIYFGQNPTPNQLLVTLRYGAQGNPPLIGSYVLGDFVGDFHLDNFKAVNNGSFSFIYGGRLHSIYNLNFTNIEQDEAIVDVINHKLHHEISNNVHMGMHVKREHAKITTVKVTSKAREGLADGRATMKIAVQNTSAETAVNITNNQNILTLLGGDIGEAKQFKANAATEIPANSTVEITITTEDNQFFDLTTEQVRSAKTAPERGEGDTEPTVAYKTIENLTFTIHSATEFSDGIYSGAILKKGAPLFSIVDSEGATHHFSSLMSMKIASDAGATSIQCICRDFDEIGLDDDSVKTVAHTVDAAYDQDIDSIDLSEATFQDGTGGDGRNVFFYLYSTELDQDFTVIQDAGHGTSLINESLLNMKKSSIFRSEIDANVPLFDGRNRVTNLNTLQGMIDNVVSFSLNEFDYATTTYTTTSFTLEQCNHIHAVGIVVAKFMSDAIRDVEFRAGAAHSFVYLQSNQNENLFFAEESSECINLLFGTADFADHPEAHSFVESPAQAFLEAINVNSKFYGVIANRESDSVELNTNHIQSLSRAVQASPNKMYFCRLNQLDIASASTNCLLSHLNDNKLDRTVPCFNALHEYFDAEVSGNFLTSLPGTGRVFGAGGSGTTASNLSPTAILNILNKNGNIKAEYGSMAVIRNGTIASSTPEYADIIRGTDWMKSELEIALADLIVNREIPYTDRGAAMVEAEMVRVFKFIEARGFIATNVDDNGDIIPSFEITIPRIANIPKQYRVNRVFFCSYIARPAGSIQKLTITGQILI